ncbi:MAG: ATP-binding protein [Bacillota bacterium]|nr:ATP-binding protein [Bacillota bacterium]
MPYIFNKFYRGDKSRNSKVPDSGLGLSTCKYIVEKHQGEIYCKDTNEKGCIFYFSIPLG